MSLSLTVIEPLKVINVLEVIDGVNHRRVVVPSDDVSSEPAEIKALAAQQFTQEVKDAYAAHISN